EKVSDGVGIKAHDGRYVYVNPALSERLGRSPEEVIGRTDADFRVAANAADELEGLPVPVDDWSLVRAGEGGPSVVVLPQESKLADAAATGQAGLPAGVPGRLTVDQAVELLVRAVELRDPFLKGHGERVAALAGAVASRLGLNAAERMTLELAGRLSQVGKIFIPDAILTKPGRHSEDEARIMRSHVERTLDLLDGIDLGLPVGFVVGQMHERLDGSGYPQGLSGDQIGLPGRILGVVDVFCARNAPRSYRDQISAGQALFHLAGQPEKFDARVVTALVGVFAESRGGGQTLLPPDQAEAA
ncbi:MAG: HD domain-containing phosphohydrolase, partial [Geminicoccaceae bacterium]|nr:HD domain-containing phosphohydrolase [Geminicoccaceae bacterium]